MNTDTVTMILAKVTNADARVRMMDSLRMKKAELVAAAAMRGLSTAGTRSNIAYRIART